jgi:hypothetical protein
MHSHRPAIALVPVIRAASSGPRPPLASSSVRMLLRALTLTAVGWSRAASARADRRRPARHRLQPTEAVRRRARRPSVRLACERCSSSSSPRGPTPRDTAAGVAMCVDACPDFGQKKRPAHLVLGRCAGRSAQLPYSIASGQANGASSSPSSKFPAGTLLTGADISAFQSRSCEIDDTTSA